MDLFFVQLCIVFLCIAIGGRFGGIGLGAAGGMGLCILTFFFHLPPDSPPVSVMLIIISVITCVSILQAVGGLDLLIIAAEKVLRKRPKAVTFLGPFLCYIFTALCGTSYIAFSLYPIIAEVAFDAKERPERAMSMSVIAANMALVASPVSAVVASMIANTAAMGVSPLQILAVTIPGTLLGCLAGCLFVYKKGAELSEDNDYLHKVNSGELTITTSTTSNISNQTKAKIGLTVFMIGIIVIILLSSVKELRPQWDGQIMSVPVMLQILMLTTASLIMICCRIEPDKLHSGSVFKAGLIGVVGIFGLSWMTGTFFGAYNDRFISDFSHILDVYPMLFGLALFVLSILIYSPAATIAALAPLGVAMGLPASILVALLPAACATFIIPGGSQIACVSFDRTGTTKIGKYVINHSFMMPGMVSLVMSVIFCLMVAKVVF